MNASGDALTIGALAEAAGVSVETVRFYQRKGLVDEPPRPAAGIRRYRQEHAARIRFIKSAQRLGFTLDEVADLLRLQDGSSCAEAREKASDKLEAVRSKLQDLQRVEQALTMLIEQCDRTSAPQRCPLIEALHDRSAAI